MAAGTAIRDQIDAFGEDAGLMEAGQVGRELAGIQLREVEPVVEEGQQRLA